jgi:hypothetical protein
MEVAGRRPTGVQELMMAKKRDNPTLDVTKILTELEKNAKTSTELEKNARTGASLTKCGLCAGVGRAPGGVCPACRGSGLTAGSPGAAAPLTPKKEPEKPVLQQSVGQFRDRLKARTRVATAAPVPTWEAPRRETEPGTLEPGTLDLSKILLRFRDEQLGISIPDVVLVQFEPAALWAEVARALGQAADRIMAGDCSRSMALGDSTHRQEYLVSVRSK